MSKPLRKAQKKLAKRRELYERMLKSAGRRSKTSERGYKRPGSMQKLAVVPDLDLVTE